MIIILIKFTLNPAQRNNELKQELQKYIDAG